MNFKSFKIWIKKCGESKRVARHCWYKVLEKLTQRLIKDFQYVSPSVAGFCIIGLEIVNKICWGKLVLNQYSSLHFEKIFLSVEIHLRFAVEAKLQKNKDLDFHLCLIVLLKFKKMVFHLSKNVIIIKNHQSKNKAFLVE